MSEHKLKHLKAECSYCGELANLTADHVPPRSWFPDVVNYQLLTVPACQKCNTGWAADAEYMRNVLMIDHRTPVNASTDEVRSRVHRGFARHRGGGPTKDIVKTMREIELRSPAGLFVGRSATFDPNLEKLERVCAQIVRGLYKIYSGQRVPITHGLGTYILGAITPQTDEQRESINQLLQLSAGGNDHRLGDVFRFDYQLMEGGSSAWYLEFYESFTSIAVTIKKTEVPPTRRLW
jgi:hypothetical protein